MKLKATANLLLILFAFVFNASADSYITFQTTRYKSANKKFVAVVTPEKRATLYAGGGTRRRIWSRQLSELPGKMFVSNDGKRIVIVDRYYGNGSDPSLDVLIILGENGQRVSSYKLAEVANLEKAMQTTSMIHWYGRTEFDTNQQFFIVQTAIRKQDCLPTEPEECFGSVPYERLRFELSTGKLVERSKSL